MYKIACVLSHQCVGDNVHIHVMDYNGDVFRLKSGISDPTTQLRTIFKIEALKEINLQYWDKLGDINTKCHVCTQGRYHCSNGNVYMCVQCKGKSVHNSSDRARNKFYISYHLPT